MPSTPARTVRRAVAVAIAAAALVATSCTTNETTTSPTGATGAGSAVPTTTPGTAATGTPIKLGWVNMERGAAALPEIGDGTDIAVDRINKYENGINGHKIELVKCDTDGTPESSAGCANTFVTAKVVAVVAGGDLGTDAMIPILKDAGIATIGGSTLGTAQTLNEAGAFFFAPPATSYPRAEVDLAAKVGAKKLAMVLPDVPQVPVVQGFAEDQAKINGIQVSVVKFDPAAPDFTAAIAAVTSGGSDAIATIATDDWCTGMARAAVAASFQGKMIMGTCSKYAREVDLSKLHGAYGLSSIWGPGAQAQAPKEANVVIDQFRAAMADAGRGEDTGGIIFGGYAGMTQVANVLRTMSGEYSAESVLAGMKALNNAPNPLGEPVTCNPRPYPGTSGCTKGWMWFEAVDANTSKLISDGFQTVKTAA